MHDVLREQDWVKDQRAVGPCSPFKASPVLLVTHLSRAPSSSQTRLAWLASKNIPLLPVPGARGDKPRPNLHQRFCGVASCSDLQAGLRQSNFSSHHHHTHQLEPLHHSKRGGKDRRDMARKVPDSGEHNRSKATSFFVRHPPHSCSFVPRQLLRRDDLLQSASEKRRTFQRWLAPR